MDQRITNHGYLFEVDLEYRKDLLEPHNDYPLDPDKMKIDNVEKLGGNVFPKQHYILHYKNLKKYLNLGLKLKKIHRGIKFYQSSWMEPYIRKKYRIKKRVKKQH